MTVTPSATGTATPLTATPTSSKTVTSTPYGSPSALSATPTVSATVSASPTPTETGHGSPTPAEIVIELEMPAQVFSGGDPCYLSLLIQNPGTARTVDVYCLLAVGGSFWAYPSWQEIGQGLDYETWTITAGEDSSNALIPQFDLPENLPAGGPFHFYAAMFEEGYLDLDHLASNGAVWEFSFE
jgi:hypothetical protein